MLCPGEVNKLSRCFNSSLYQFNMIQMDTCPQTVLLLTGRTEIQERKTIKWLKINWISLLFVYFIKWANALVLRHLIHISYIQQFFKRTYSTHHATPTKHMGQHVVDLHQEYTIQLQELFHSSCLMCVLHLKNIEKYLIFLVKPQHTFKDACT